MGKQSVYFKVDNLNDAHDEKEIKRSLDEIKGVFSVTVNLGEEMLGVDYDDSALDENDLKTRLDGLGHNANVIGQNNQKWE